MGTARITSLAVCLNGEPLTEAAVNTPWVREGAQAQMSAEDLMRAASLWRAGVHDLFALSSQSIAHMDAMVGPSDSIVIAGGWIHDPMVRAAKKAALGAFRVSEVNEAGAMGAAMFAAISCGEMERPSATQTPRWQA